MEMRKRVDGGTYIIIYILIMESMKVSIRSYSGIVDDGVVALLSINIENEYYDALYWYDEFTHLIVSPDEVNDSLGVSNIRLHPEYPQILKYLKSNREDYYVALDKLFKAAI